jgi:hypothetical protein
VLRYISLIVRSSRPASAIFAKMRNILPAFLVLATALAAPIAPSSPAPAPTDDPSPLSGDLTLLQTINKWRYRYGREPIRWSTSFADSAATFATETINRQPHTGLGSGVQIQAPSPGFVVPPPGANLEGFSPFELQVLSWLCESPQDPQLQPAENGGVNVCYVQQRILDISSSTSMIHDAVLTTSLNSVGCAYRQYPVVSIPQWAGIWDCAFGSQ